jgi:3' terminal RNA ribose 2'-O-methyltransferase Hen1
VLFCFGGTSNTKLSIAWQTMLLSISTTHQPATDLGYLLHKHPARVFRKEQSFGVATVFFSEAKTERATAVLAVDVDAIGLVRAANDAFALAQYVNDRPYAASSFLSVSLANCFASAMGGRCNDKPELAMQAIPLEITIVALPVGAQVGVACFAKAKQVGVACFAKAKQVGVAQALLERLFGPLGYQVSVVAHALDARFAASWGDSRYVDLTLRATCTLQALLQHLYVLIPVLDNDKHYWIGSDEVDKLVRKSADWLPSHPEREFITRRYLKNRRALVDEALARLSVDVDAPEQSIDKPESREEKVEKPLGLNTLRLDGVAGLIEQLGAKTAVDLGCGEGKLLRRLLDNPKLKRIVGMDVSMRSLQVAADRLKLDRMSERQRERLELLHGSLIYRDQRLSGFDVASVIEVIEHLDPHRLTSFARVLFVHVAAQHIVITTPNVEYNVRFENLPAGQFRHTDHRFEWTRAEFESWATAQAAAHGYTVRFFGIGVVDEALGAPTQAAHFSKSSAQAAVLT